MYINITCNGCIRKSNGKCMPDCKHFPKDKPEPENIGKYELIPTDMYEKIKELEGK